MEYDKIKLIIWDLDETFWKGTLSEENVIIPKENIELIKNLTKRGIINSICSKNEKSEVQKKLKEIELEDYFVFNSINWDAKGPRIKATIESMALRDSNVLFIDDNLSNLNEAKFYCNNIMTSTPDIIDDLIKICNTIGKDDAELSRLKQYKVLEQKKSDSEKFESSEKFLYASNICVEIEHDSLDQIERLHELALRSNQLNFTKIRPSIEEFKEDINSAKNHGYVKVKDNYGDYGIVGFYLVDSNDKVKHFFFSCRTMGMGIEQYVYSTLGFPQITIVGPVSGSLNKSTPKWINNKNMETSNEQQITDLKILMKGPCDMQGIADYIQGNNIDTEFYYVDDLGRQIENQTHIVNILNCTLDKKQKSELLNYNIFSVDDLFESKMFNNNYDIIIFSMVSFYNFGVYKHKKSGLMYAVGQNCYDLTDSKNWDKYISGEYFNGNFKLKKSDLEKFSDDFEKFDYDANKMIDDIYRLCEILKNKRVILILGNEKFNVKNPKGNYIDRERLNHEFNQKIKNRLLEFDNLELLDVNKFINSEKDLLDSINHYSRRVLYNIALELTNLLNESNNEKLKISHIKRISQKIKRKLKIK